MRSDQIAELTSGIGEGFGPDLTVSFEFFPPKSDELEKSFWHTVDKLATLRPKFMTVTYGAGGTTREKTRMLVMKMQQNTNTPTASHLTCVASTKADVDELARLYWAVGIKHIVALRGDMPSGGPFVAHPQGYAGSVEMIEGLKKVAPFEISVAAYPEKHPSAPSMDDDIAVLKRKFDAGADRAISQYFFEPVTFMRFLEKTSKAGITKPIVPGIMPIGNFTQVVKFSKACGASVPQLLHDTFEGL
jgi:methylenetetrahydrofolate reductase (NADPH)